MPAKLDVDREQVRMLVLSIGVREAARKCGIAEGTVQDWSAKGKWLAPTRPTPALLPQPASMIGPTSPTKPADALSNILSERHKDTKLGLSKWSSKTAKKLGEMDGEDALAAHPVAVSVASVMGKVWPDQERTSLRLTMFGPSGPVVDVESSYSPE